MKTRNSFLIIALLGILSVCGKLSNETTESEDSIIGVWEYVEDDVLNNVSGMSFFTEKHFAFVMNYEADSVLNVLAHSGTYVLEDSIVTATVKSSHIPALIGQKMQWIHGTDGEYASYQVLDQNRNVVETGKVRRLE